MKSKLVNKKSNHEQRIDFVPVRWWQMIPFLHLNFELVRNVDPRAERILSHPWALSSMLEYIYMSGVFLRSIAHFLTISGKRAGVVWTYYQAGIGFILSVGILRQFQKQGMGIQTVNFIEDYIKERGGDILVAVMAARNKPVQWLTRAVGGRPLGLATTTLTLSTVDLPISPSFEIEVRRLEKPEAARAWKHWRLHEVERVAGDDGVRVAARLLESYYWLERLPQGRHLGLYQNAQKIGSAHVQRGKSGLHLYLFPSDMYWSGSHTADLIAVLVSYLKSPVDCLTLTQTHADALAIDAPFDFERREEEERFYAFKFI
jgi:GNAT superfamily N-acetyltransferase